MSSAPTVIHRYQIIDRIGQGGMGALYLARDPLLDRLVAIKLLREGFDNDELRERFAREARSAARLSHINIVAIFDFGEHEGQPFIAMEYIPGETLAEMIRRRAPIPLAQRLRYIEDMCAGLSHAHKAQIVHRDVKPANVMVSPDGQVKVLDFGIARLADSSMTKAGMIVGTLNYMSPEQVAGGAIDHRSDVFAVGAVFYELLSYRQPFPGGLSDGILHRILNAPPEPLDRLCPDLDPEVVEIVRRAIEKAPAHRYQQLSTMRREIARVRARIERESPQFDDTLIVSPNDETVAVRLPRPPAGPGSGPGAGAGSGATPRTPTPSGRRGANQEALEQRRAAEVAARLEAADAAFGEGDYPAAIAAAEAVLLLAPDNQQAHAMIDRCHAAEDAAVAAAAIEAARGALGAGDLERASQEIERAAELDAAHAGVASLRAEIDAARQRAAEARRRAAGASEALARAERSFQDGSFESAIRAASEALALEPALAEAQALKLRAAERMEGERRRREYEQAARVASDEAEGHLARGEFQAAFDALARVVPPHPAHEPLKTRIREAAAEAERQRLAEEERQRAEARARRTEEERKAREEAERRAEAERQRKAEQARLAEEERRRKAAERARIAEEERKAREAEQARLAEERRRQEEQEQRRREEAERVAREEAERAAAAHLAAAQAVVAEARAAFEEGRHPEAIASLERFSPSHEVTRAALADLRTQFGAIEQARREREEAARRAEAERRRREEEARAAAERARQARDALKDAAAAIEAGDARGALAAVARARDADPSAEAGDLEARAGAIIEEEQRAEAERRRQAREARIAAIKKVAGDRRAQAGIAAALAIALAVTLLPRLTRDASQVESQGMTGDSSPGAAAGTDPPPAGGDPATPDPAKPPADPGRTDPPPADPSRKTEVSKDPAPRSEPAAPTPPPTPAAPDLTRPRTLYEQGRRADALGALLSVDGQLAHSSSRDLMAGWIKEAMSEVANAATEAEKSGVPTSSAAYQQAATQRTAAEGLRQRSPEQALRSYWSAAERFSSLEPPPPPAKTEPKPAPPAKPESPPPPEPAGPSADEKAIVGVIAGFERARASGNMGLAEQYKRLDNAERSFFQTAYPRMRSYSYRLALVGPPRVEGNRATVPAREEQVLGDARGIQAPPGRNVTIRLERSRDTWIITAIDPR